MLSVWTRQVGKKSLTWLWRSFVCSKEHLVWMSYSKGKIWIVALILGFRVHVSMANFIDTLIDYPKSLDYSFQMFDKIGQLGILKGEEIEKYK